MCRKQLWVCHRTAFVKSSDIKVWITIGTSTAETVSRTKVYSIRGGHTIGPSSNRWKAYLSRQVAQPSQRDRLTHELLQFGHNTPTLQTGQTDRQTDRQRSNSIGRTVLQTVAQKLTKKYSNDVSSDLFRQLLVFRACAGSFTQKTKDPQDILNVIMSLEMSVCLSDAVTAHTIFFTLPVTVASNINAVSQCSSCSRHICKQLSHHLGCLGILSVE